MSSQAPVSLNRQTQMIDKPIEYSERRCTDVCCIVIGLLFSIALITYSFFVFNSDTYTKASLPSDTTGKVCGIDYPLYTIVYFANPSDPSQRVCVSACPSKGDSKLMCTPAGNIGCRFNNAPGFAVTYYDNTYVANTNGQFCMPSDDNARQTIEEKLKLGKRNTFFNSVNVLGLCLAIAIGLSIIYFLLVQYCPKPMTHIAIYLGFVVCLALAVLIFLYKTEDQTTKIILAVILAFAAIVTLITILCRRPSIDMCAALIRESTRFVSANCCVVVYIPIFTIITGAFLFIVLMEYRAFWSSGNASFTPSNLYYDVRGVKTYILSGLLLIQTIWGLSFIKEAFNFCVSGNAVYWYLGQSVGCCETIKTLICKHLGSVIASGFISAFFAPIDFVLDLLKPSTDDDGCVNKYLCCCAQVFDLARSDALAYINLTGNPFCNSSKYCEYLCKESFVCDENQSTNRTYRICAHILIAGIICILAMYIKGSVQIFIIAVIFIFCIFLSTFFISLHADAAQAIQVMFLIEEEFSKRKGNSKTFMDFESLTDRAVFLNSKQFHKNHQELADEIIANRQDHWAKPATTTTR